MDPAKVETIVNWKQSKNSTKIHSFMGLTGSYLSKTFTSTWENLEDEILLRGRECEGSKIFMPYVKFSECYISFCYWLSYMFIALFNKQMNRYTLGEIVSFTPWIINASGTRNLLWH